MAKTYYLLGKNARNQVYLRFNKKRGRKIADSKLLTKKILSRHNLPHPKLYAVFETIEDLNNFQWEKLPGNFVVKPSRGLGGDGILVIKKKGKWAGEWYLMGDEKIDISQIRQHILDIFAGRFSLHNLPDKAFVEERVKIHPIFKRYTYRGTPDIRIIVFNKVPVMAMLRLPTPESRGKANLHQGAIGVGIDLATGITTYGFYNGRRVKLIPGTKKKINGLKLPFWEETLILAVKIQEVVSQLGFFGVDIILDKEKGPMILELNARPGLDIQNANLAPLRGRLARVEGLTVDGAEKGVKIAQDLFAERFADKVLAKKGAKIINVLEEVKIKAANKKTVSVLAKIDTGALRSSIDKKLAEELGLLTPENTIFTRYYQSALGKRKERKVISLTFYLKGRRIKTSASVTRRSHLKTPFLVGLRDLMGFLVRPEPIESAQFRRI
ncbi:MAG TPA: sugar-transfer associated ATP-grasp domain-containing protein [Patescibacteria group bacterium]|nr:sugar-transfer associated ATP-grasp domain-containing protein [Patescibacteria group bacterium]